MNGKPWNAHDLATLREMYPDRPTVEIAAKLGRSLSNVYVTARRLGLKKSEAFLASEASGIIGPGKAHDGRGAAFRFPKGHVPANKGTRRPGWAPGRMRETQFKPGSRRGAAAQNWKPVGTVVPGADGYLRIKVRETEPGEATGFRNPEAWPQLHRHVWEQHHGPVPDGHIVVFRDRDRTNCAIENLELISLAENLRRNSIWEKRYPAELTSAIMQLGQLKRRIRERSRASHG